MYYLLIIWISLLGADRINFLKGIGNFTLTPFLILSMVIIFLIIIFQIRIYEIPYGIRTFFMVVNIFLSITLISVIFAMDIDIGFKRFILLVFQIYFTTIIFLLINKQKKETIIKIFLYGSCLGVFFSFCSDILQMMNWLNISSFNFNNFVDTIPQVYYTSAPRLSGVSIDPNRGGIVLCFYLFFIIKLSNSRILKYIFTMMAVFLILITFSRSAIGSLAIMILILWLKSNSRVSDLKKFLVFTLFAFFIFTLVYNFFGKGIDFQSLLSERLSVSGNTSGGSHLSLMNNAIETWTTSFKNVFIGIGFANSYHYLSDFFGKDTYGNYHSIYLSILVENGLFGLSTFIVLFIYPILRKNIYLALMGALLVFNIFYQLTLEPMFWFSIVLSWANVRFETRTI